MADGGTPFAKCWRKGHQRPKTGQKAEQVRGALVPIFPGCTEACANFRSSGARPSADFVAHIVATRIQAPQTRVRRRAEPQHAIAAYGAVAHCTDRTGAVVSRTL